MDPNPGDLIMARMKLGLNQVEVRTDRCWKIGGWVVIRGKIGNFAPQIGNFL